MLAPASLGEDAALLDLLVEATQGAFERLVLTHSDFCQSRFTSPGQGSCGCSVGLAASRPDALPDGSPVRGWRSRSRGVPDRSNVRTFDSRHGRATVPTRVRHSDAMPTRCSTCSTQAVARYGDRNALGLRRDDGTTTHWSYRELDRRVAARGLAPAGARPRAGRPAPDLVAIDARSSRRPTSGRCGRGSSSSRSTCGCRPTRSRASSRPSGAQHLVLGTGRDAPDPREAGLDRFPTTTVEALGRRARRPPSRPTGRRSSAAWPAPGRRRDRSSSSSRRARPARRRA